LIDPNCGLAVRCNFGRDYISTAPFSPYGAHWTKQQDDAKWFWNILRGAESKKQYGIDAARVFVAKTYESDISVRRLPDRDDSKSRLPIGKRQAGVS
jgi:hypothetical protein